MFGHAYQIAKEVDRVRRRTAQLVCDVLASLLCVDAINRANPVQDRPIVSFSWDTQRELIVGPLQWSGVLLAYFEDGIEVCGVMRMYGLGRQKKHKQKVVLGIHFAFVRYVTLIAVALVVSLSVWLLLV